MHKIFAVVRREFVERVRKRSFWIMAILGPVFFAAVFLLPILLSGASRHKHIVLVDRTSSGFGTAVAKTLDSEGHFTVERLGARGHREAWGNFGPARRGGPAYAVRRRSGACSQGSGALPSHDAEDHAR